MKLTEDQIERLDEISAEIETAIREHWVDPDAFDYEFKKRANDAYKALGHFDDAIFMLASHIEYMLNESEDDE